MLVHTRFTNSQIQKFKNSHFSLSIASIVRLQ